MTGHDTHSGHDHAHRDGCGHTAVRHEGHVEDLHHGHYLSNGHLQRPHEGHCDDHGRLTTV